jgi:DNA-binding transcriptional LysR family regulator
MDQSASPGHSPIAGFAKSHTFHAWLTIRRSTERFDWTLVRSFLAVLDAGSLMGAARRHRRQQPTLSRHMPSWRRSWARRCSSAPAAASCRPRWRWPSPSRAPDAGRRRRAGRRRWPASVQATTGTVRITTSQVAASWLLPPCWPRCSGRSPGIQVELVASNALSNLLRREADIAVRMVRPAQGSLVARKLGEMPIVAAAHEQLPGSAPARRASPADLLQHRLIGYDRDDTMLRGFAGWACRAARTDSRCAPTTRWPTAGWWPPAPASALSPPTTCAHWPGCAAALLPMLKIPPLPGLLAGRAPRDPRQPAGATGSTTHALRRQRRPAALKHDPFKALVVPRPDRLDRQRRRQGRPNLAPYSFFNARQRSPADGDVLVGRPQGQPAQHRGHRRVHLLAGHHGLREAMNLSSARWRRAWTSSRSPAWPPRPPAREAAARGRQPGGETTGPPGLHGLFRPDPPKPCSR